MTREEIINELKKDKNLLLRQMGVQNIPLLKQKIKNFLSNNNEAD